MPDTSQLLRAYAVVGPDELKRKATLDKIQSYLDSSMLDFNLEFRDASQEEGAQGLLSSFAALPFADSLRVVVVNQADKLESSIVPAIVEYLQNPNPTTTVLFVADALRSNSKLYKAISALGKKAIISCEAPVKDELTALIVQLAQKHGFRMGHEAAKELAYRAGSSTQLLSAHIETLSHVCAGEVEISLQAVKDNISQTEDIPPWELLDALCERNAQKALKILALISKPSYVYIQMTMYYRMRELLIARSCLDRGDAGAIKPMLVELSDGRMTSAKLPDWKVRKYRAWAERFSTSELVDVLGELAAFERACKGQGDERAALIHCIHTICR